MDTIKNIPASTEIHKLIILGSNTISFIPPELKSYKLVIAGNNNITKIPKLSKGVKKLKITEITNKINLEKLKNIPISISINILEIYGTKIRNLIYNLNIYKLKYNLDCLGRKN